MAINGEHEQAAVSTCNYYTPVRERWKQSWRFGVQKGAGGVQV
jgi:hypothetical protein